MPPDRSSCAFAVVAFYSKVKNSRLYTTTIFANGRMEWRCDEKLHRDCDYPAVVHPNGAGEWYCHGVRTRDNDLPAYQYLRNARWYKNGNLHRENGPAVDEIVNEFSSEPIHRQIWYTNGVETARHERWL